MKKLFKVLILSIIVISAIQREGYMGDAIENRISIKDLINRSDYIVVAKKSEPHMLEIGIDITPENETKDKDKYPPYLKREYNYIVEDILYARTLYIPFENKMMKIVPDIKKNTNIRVVSPDFENNLKYHKDYHIRGIMASPITNYYVSEDNRKELKTEDKIIVFLKTRDYKEYRFTVVGAEESFLNIKKVKKFINKKWWQFWK